MYSKLATYLQSARISQRIHYSLAITRASYLTDVLRTFKKLIFSFICDYYFAFIRLQYILNKNLSKTDKNIFLIFLVWWVFVRDGEKWVLVRLKNSFAILQIVRNKGNSKWNFNVRYLIFIYLYIYFKFYGIFIYFFRI